MSDDEDKVVPLPVKFKTPPKDSVVLFFDRHGCAGTGKCNHMYQFAGNIFEPSGGRMVKIAYLIRDGETEVECGACGVRLDPMWVLQQLAKSESEMNRRRRMYQDEMQRLRERRRTKCQHCGQMTTISAR